MKRSRKRKAVALGYTAKDQAPIVLATGEGIVADKIITAAAENDISILEHEVLVENLIHLPQGTEIPQELYQIVAEIYAFLVGVDDKVIGNK